MAEPRSQEERKEVTAIPNEDHHRCRKATIEKSDSRRAKEREHRRRQNIRKANKKVVRDYPPLLAQVYADSGAKLKSEQHIKQDWNSDRRQDRRWLNDLIERGDERAPTGWEREAFTRISKLSTLEEIYDALEKGDILPNVKHLYVALLYEREEAIKMQHFGDTDVVKDWWSKEKAWTLGGDLPEEGARHIAWDAWNKRLAEEVVVEQEWADLTEPIYSYDSEAMPAMPFAGPLLPPDFKDLETSGMEPAEWASTVAGGSNYGSEEVEMGEEMREEAIQEFEEGSQVRGEELHAKIAGWDSGAGRVGMEDNGEAWSEEEDTGLPREECTGWRMLKPGEEVRWIQPGAGGFRDLETPEASEEPRTPEHQIINYDS